MSDAPVVLSVQDELVALVKSAVEKKPTTVLDALALLHLLDVKLGVWVVSELSASQQKEVLAAKWDMQHDTRGITTPWWCIPQKK